MPDWITVIIVLLIVGIVLDGVRRVRIHRRENIRLSRRAKLADAEAETSAGSSHSEFPSGGARVAGYREPDEAENFNKNVRESFTTKRTTVGAPSRIPEQVTLNLDETVPMLMESVEVEADSSPDSVDILEVEPNEEFSVNGDDLGILAHAPGEALEEAPETRSFEEASEAEPSLGSLDSLDDDLDSEPAPPAPKSAGSKLFGTKGKTKVDGVGHSNVKEASPRAAPEEPEPSQDKLAEPEEVLIINVMAKKGELFIGEALMEVLVEQHIKFGDMDIFHRHTGENGDGPIIFSIANMVVPGTFNLASMDTFTTPGISLFLSLPVEAESLAAFNTMAETARAIADALGGELKDENRSVMTKQTIEHARQKVMEFERKRQLRSRK